MVAPRYNQGNNHMLTNTQIDTLASAIKAASELDKKETTFADRVAAMKAGGWTDSMLDTKSDGISEVRNAVAGIALTPAQVKVWSDTSLALKVADAKSKTRVDTPRGKLVKLVDMRIARIRKALSKADAEPSKKGAKPEPRKLPTRILDEVVKLKNAVEKDATSEAPELDSKIRVELLAAFARIVGLVAKH
jgi:hypothetical protein